MIDTITPAFDRRTRTDAVSDRVLDADGAVLDERRRWHGLLDGPDRDRDRTAFAAERVVR